MVAGILTAVIAIVHVYFFWLETVIWNTPKGRKVFRLSEDEAAKTAVLAANQGVYNLCLAAGLFGTFFLEARNGQVLRMFILLMIGVVGLYGARTVSKKIFFVQSLPAFFALAAVIFT